MRRVLARGMVLTLAAAVVACAGPEGSHPIPRWELTVDGRAPLEVELPAHLDVPPRDLEYRLTTRLDVPDALVGRPLELTLPHLAAEVALVADGQPVGSRERRGLATYRHRGPHHFELPAKLAEDGELALELTVSHRWTQSAWVDVLPVIALPPTETDRWAWVTFVNGPVTLAALLSIFAVGLTWLLVYLSDRRRKAHLWFGVQAISASTYPAFAFGVLEPLFGRYDAVVMLLGLASALAGSLYFTHSLFSLGRVPRSLLVLLGGSSLVALAAPGPHHVTLVGGRLVVLSVVLVTIYQVARCATVVRDAPDHRKDAASLLFAWIGLGLTAWADLAYWFGLGDAVSGLRPASLGLISFAFLLFVLMSRHHTNTLSRSDELNVELTHQVEALQHRQQEIEHLNDELRHQVSDRSAQLFVALAAVATGVRAALPELGAVLNDRYRVVRRLGEGGMGTVFEVERLRDRVVLAAKFPSESDGIAMARLAREAHVASMVVHPNLVRIVDVDFLPSGHLFFVMELAEGGTLRERREACSPWPIAAQVLAQIARGLEALHAQGLVHRDVKPSNVVFARTRAGLVAKLADFGISRPSLSSPTEPDPTDARWRSERPRPLSTVPIAKRALATPVAPHPIDDAEDPTPLLPGVARAGAHRGSSSSSSPHALTLKGQVAGTPRYMAPELTSRPGTFSPPSDVFSFGVLAFELLLGVDPFVEPPAQAVAEGREPPPPLPIDASIGLPLEIVALVEACLSFDPLARPTASEAAIAFERMATVA